MRWIESIYLGILPEAERTRVLEIHWKLGWNGASGYLSLRLVMLCLLQYLRTSSVRFFETASA